VINGDTQSTGLDDFSTGSAMTPIAAHTAAAAMRFGRPIEAPRAGKQRPIGPRFAVPVHRHSNVAPQPGHSQPAGGLARPDH